MTKKENILKAWMTMEHFSEGDIDLKEDGNVKYKLLPKSCDSWTTFFIDELNNLKEYKQLLPQKSKNIGFRIFFDIFRFDDLINEFASRFHLTEEYRDDSNSEKFTYCLSFVLKEDNLELVEDSLFYTMSGYAHRYEELTVEMEKKEEDLQKRISELFEYDFEEGLTKLIESEVSWSSQNYYELQIDVTKADPLFHSFYIKDLELAVQHESDNLNRYLFGYLGERINLDTNKMSRSFNGEAIATILEPKNYPLGRFPSNPNWGLSLMQQIAVNLALNDENNIHGVNGPPGTGKTTLLKDIFAELIVRQAHEICELTDYHLNETETYFKNGKIAKIPDAIANKTILVASSNNGAVQNIVNELPQKGQIDKQFLDEILTVDYFTSSSNDEISNENWGTFATEGGKSINRKKMIELIKKLSDELKSEEFIPNNNAYHDFSKQYNLVKNMRDAAQKIAILHKKLSKLYSELNDKTKIFEKKFSKKKAEYEEKKKQQNKKMNELDELIIVHENQLAFIENERTSNNYQLEVAKLNLETVKEQKPVALLFLKMIHHSSSKLYMEQISTASNSMMQLLEDKQKIEEEYKIEEKNVTALKSKRKNHSDNEKIMALRQIVLVTNLLMS